MLHEPPYRIGIGFDFHPFSGERELWLGGVRIPFDRGLLGHSDADALLHALADAILGAAGLPDIGHFFPDSDPAYKGMSSLALLERVWDLVTERGYRVGNVDVVVIAEVPRIKPHVAEMKEKIARCLEIDPTAVGIKATTMERKGVIGREEGIAAEAVVLLYRIDRADDSY